MKIESLKAKALAFVAIGLMSWQASSQQLPKAPLSDFGGQIISLYGMADYKTGADSLKSHSQGLIPVPFDGNGKPAMNPDGSLNFAAAKYAVVGLVRYQARYGFTSMDPMQALLNPT